MNTRPDAGPRLELDWEEHLFRALRALWRRLTPRAQPRDDLDLLPLEPRQERLAYLARIVAAQPLDIAPCDANGGPRRSALLLPRHLPALDPQEDPWLLRVLIDATVAAHLPHLPPDADPPACQAATLHAVGAALAALREHLPDTQRRFDLLALRLLPTRPPLDALQGRDRALEEHRQRALRGCWPQDPHTLAATLRALPRRGAPSPPIPLWGDLAPADNALKHPGAEADTTPTGREVQAPRTPQDLRRALLKAEEEYNPLVHTFEKVETLDEHRGGYRQPDGSDELDEHLEALEELDLREVFRGGPPAEALLKIDLPFASSIPDVESIAPGERGLPYDEWDERAGRYRTSWCTVYPTPLHIAPSPWGAQVAAQRQRLIADLRKRLEIHRSVLTAQRRQRDGESIDLDAALSAWVDQRAGEEGDDRLYIRQARRRRDVATLVLLDLSLSTDAWIEGQRVLDVAREALVVLGEVAHQLGDDLSIQAFASKTRNACRIWEIKTWDDPWTRARERLGALTPQGYTRIGPALRHATATLKAHPADRRLVLLLSDGKPTDFDRYEGRYGIHDVRMALREADAQGVQIHALTIDSHARPALAATFGVGQWTLLRHPEALPRALTEAYGRLSR